MPNKPRANSTIGRPSNVLEQGGMNPKPPLKLPSGLSPEVRRMARTLIKQSPHLEQPQVNALVRYVQLSKRWDELELIVEKEGPIINSMRDGEWRENPALSAQLKVAMRMDTLERSLLIQQRARRELLTTKERQPQSTIVKKTKGGPKLRIA